MHTGKNKKSLKDLKREALKDPKARQIEEKVNKEHKEKKIIVTKPKPKESAKKGLNVVDRGNVQPITENMQKNIPVVSPKPIVEKNILQKGVEAVKGELGAFEKATGQGATQQLLSVLPIGRLRIGRAAIRGISRANIVKSIVAGDVKSGFVSNVVANVKTSNTIKKWLVGAGVTLGIATIITGAIQSISMGNFVGKEEAAQNVGFAYYQAVLSGNQALIDRALEEEGKIYDTYPSWRDNIPYVSTLKGIDDFINVSKASWEIRKEIEANKKEQVKNKENEDAYWDRIRKKQAQQEKENIDYYNKQRKEMIRWEEEAKAKEREKEAKFWADEREKQRKLEEKERDAIADFWLAYRKERLRMNEDQSPSKLNFGLL